MLLQDSCWVLELLRDSGKSFLLRAWCFDPNRLHLEMDLHIIEPGIDEQKKCCLTYNISIAVSPVPLQLTPNIDTSSPSSEDGQFGEGNDRDPANSQHRRLPPQPQRGFVHLRIGAQYVPGKNRTVCMDEEAERTFSGASGIQHSIQSGPWRTSRPGGMRWESKCLVAPRVLQGGYVARRPMMHALPT
jgi:hypothetical protein